MTQPAKCLEMAKNGRMGPYLLDVMQSWLLEFFSWKSAWGGSSSTWGGFSTSGGGIPAQLGGIPAHLGRIPAHLGTAQPCSSRPSGAAMGPQKDPGGLWMLLGLQAVAEPWCPCLSRANTALNKTQKCNGSRKRRAEPSLPKLPLCTLQMSFCGQVEGKSSTMWEKLSTSPGEGGGDSREHPGSIVLAVAHSSRATRAPTAPAEPGKPPQP